MRVHLYFQAEKFGTSFVPEVHISAKIKATITQAVSVTENHDLV